MKKNILAISMLTTAGLFAENTNNQPPHEQSGYCNTCCCTPCCCVPCCVPQPKKCIDCECYTPQFYDLQCDWGFFIDAEFLYWYARESNTAFSATITLKDPNEINPSQTLPGGIAEISKLNNIGTSWDPGVRVGLGWNSSCDGWDLYLNWTYFKNSKSKTARGTRANQEVFGFEAFGDTKIMNRWQSSLDQDDGYYQTVSSKWRVRFNQIDLELGRKYWLSPCFTLRPYVGLRGAWTRTRLVSNGQNGPGLREPTSTRLDEIIKKDNEFKNRIWGVGFLAGLQPNWYFCSNFGIYGNLDGALIWGEHKGRKKEKKFEARTENDERITGENYSVTAPYSFCQMSALLDLGIGLRWEETWCCDRFRTTLDLGWEHHIWWDHSTRFQEQGQVNLFFDDTVFRFMVGPVGYTLAVSNLTYGGFVLRVRFDF